MTSTTIQTKTFPLKIVALGGITGLVNGLFGSGGGTIAAPFFENLGLSTKQAHATSVAAILIISSASVGAFLVRGTLNTTLAISLIPWGFVGAVLGTSLLKKVSNKIVHRAFGLLIIISSLRLLFF